MVASGSRSVEIHTYIHAHTYIHTFTSLLFFPPTELAKEVGKIGKGSVKERRVAGS